MSCHLMSCVHPQFEGMKMSDLEPLAQQQIRTSFLSSRSTHTVSSEVSEAVSLAPCIMEFDASQRAACSAKS